MPICELLVSVFVNHRQSASAASCAAPEVGSAFDHSFCVPILLRRQGISTKTVMDLIGSYVVVGRWLESALFDLSCRKLYRSVRLPCIR